MSRAHVVGVKCMITVELAISLVEITDEDLVRISMRSSEEFELSNCEVVDESIYGNRTTLIADVVQKLAGDERFHRLGTTLGFSAQDVVTANICSSGRVLYEAIT